MKKITAVLSSLALASLFFTQLQSCNNCETSVTYAQLLSTSAELKYISGIDTADEYPKFDLIDSNSTLKRYDSIAIKINNVLKYAASHISPPHAFSLNTATACTPSINGLEQITAVTITSNENYNDTFPKGTNLEPVMLVHANNMLAGRRIKHFFSGDYNKASDSYLYRFASPPSESRFHTLTFRYFLMDGREISTTINNILIKN